jgi:hypothetical protein
MTMDKEVRSMRGADGLRRTGYAAAGAVALTGFYVVMVQGGWVGAALLAAGAAIIGVVEQINTVTLRRSQPR